MKLDPERCMLPTVKLKRQSYLISLKPKTESGHGTTESGTCYAWVWSCLGPILSHYALSILSVIGMYFLY